MKFNFDRELDEKLIQSDDKTHEYKTQKFLSLRFFVSFICMLGCAVMYMTRNNLNVAIVDMVTTIKSDSALKSSPTLVEDQCPIDGLNATTNWRTREFNWSPSTQGIVLGAFYYGEKHFTFDSQVNKVISIDVLWLPSLIFNFYQGYVWPQIFGGRLSEIYGARYMIGSSIFISALINFLTPFIIRLDFNLFIISRVVLGLVQGILFPSFMALMAKWIPRSEFSTFIPWLDVGCTVGTVIVSGGAGYLIENNVMGGWPSVFYISGKQTFF